MQLTMFGYDFGQLWGKDDLWIYGGDMEVIAHLTGKSFHNKMIKSGNLTIKFVSGSRYGANR